MCNQLFVVSVVWGPKTKITNIFNFDPRGVLKIYPLNMAYPHRAEHRIPNLFV